jgi:hypothetical protein
VAESRGVGGAGVCGNTDGTVSSDVVVGVRQKVDTNTGAHLERMGSSQSPPPMHHHSASSDISPASQPSSPFYSLSYQTQSHHSGRRIHSIIHSFSKTTETHVPPHAHHSSPPTSQQTHLISSHLRSPYRQISPRSSLTRRTNGLETQATVFTSPTQLALARSFHPRFRASDWLSV